MQQLIKLTWPKLCMSDQVANVYIYLCYKSHCQHFELQCLVYSAFRDDT